MTLTALLIFDMDNFEVLESGPSISEKELEKFYEKYEVLLEKSSIIVASGSLPRGLPRDTFKKLIIKARDRGNKNR